MRTAIVIATCAVAVFIAAYKWSHRVHEVYPEPQPARGTLVHGIWEEHSVNECEADKPSVLICQVDGKTKEFSCHCEVAE